MAHVDDRSVQATRQLFSHVTHQVAVIGAGWAGLACAHLLSSSEHVHIRLYEAAPHLGGRARSLGWTPDKQGESITIDNGQHMLVGAYRESLALIRAVGVPTKQFDRFPVTLTSADGLSLQGARLPAPWHLLFAALRSQGLRVSDFLALRRLQRLLQRCKFRPDERLTVSELLAQAAVTERVRERLMRPLCLATLNTPVHLASAAIFAAVLRDTLFANARASDFLIARVGLSEIFATPMEQHLLARGVEIHKNARVARISRIEPNRSLELSFYSDIAPMRVDSVVIATPLSQIPDLLEPENLNSAVHLACALRTESIVTLYCYWTPGASAESVNAVSAFSGDRPLRLPIMLNDTKTESPGQWLFDHGPTPAQGRMMAVVVSAADASIPNDLLKQQCLLQLARELDLPAPNYVKCIREKNATFSASAPCNRPGNTAFVAWHPNLLLAGDYTIPDYPATLESAVRSGQAAAGLLLDRLVKPH
jgi:hydroxysqualene dehydroxylase